jgi:hypothetical protein
MRKALARPTLTPSTRLHAMAAGSQPSRISNSAVRRLEILIGSEPPLAQLGLSGIGKAEQGTGGVLECASQPSW